MPISISVTDVVKLFRDKGVQEKEEIISFLEIIADDAEKLCEYWREIHGLPPLSRERAMAGLRQRALFSKVSVEYERASGILGLRLGPEKCEELLDALGAMMVTRNKIRAAHEYNILELDPNSRELLDLLEALHTEAGVLRGVAAALQASL
jgi:hypothetical protein